jgi:hypothetical protein
MGIEQPSTIVGCLRYHSGIRERNDDSIREVEVFEPGFSRWGFGGRIVLEANLERGSAVRRSVDLSRLLSSEAISQTRLADQTGVILDVDSLQVFSVNETGMCLVEALRDGVDDHDGLVKKLVGEFAIDEETAAADIDAFVEELAHYLVDRRI